MAQFDLMYELVKIVDNHFIKNSEDNFMVGFTEGDPHHWQLLESKSDIIGELSKKEDLKPHEANSICESAIEYGYLKPHPTVRLGDGEKLYVTPGAGKNLLYKHGKFRLGLLNEKIKHFNPVLTVALTIIAAAFLGNIVEIIRLIYQSIAAE